MVSVSVSFVRYLAFSPREDGRVLSSSWGWWVKVVLVIVPIHLLSVSAAEIGFRWDRLALAWSRPGLPLLSNLAGPVQHFKAAILDAWCIKVAV